MPALPNVPKTVRVDHHWLQDGNIHELTRLHWSYSGTLNTADATTWLTSITTALNTFTAAIMSTSVAHVESVLTDLSSNTAPQIVSSNGHTGGNGNPTVPAGVAFVIGYEINRRYRGGKPRSYLPGFAAGWLSNPNAWNPAQVATPFADWVTFLASCAVTPGGTAIGTITQSNISYYEGFVNHTYPSGRTKAIPQPRATPLVDTIIAARYNIAPGSQRRRNTTG